MNNITLKVIRKHFKDNNFEPRHSLHGIKYAINMLNKEVEDDAYSLLLLIINNTPIDRLYTHSYGFHTENGRYLIDTFKEYYYEYEQENN